MRAIGTIVGLMLVGICATGTAGGAEEPQNRVVAGNSRFALQLYQHLRPTDGNLFFSPYSISTAMAMTYAGAKGQTERQMATALCLPTSADVLEAMGLAGAPMTPEQFAQAFGAVIKDLNAQGQAGPYELKVANALWGQAGYAFLPTFTELVETEYGGRLREMDFVEAAEQARQTINAWVARQTNDKIKNLITPGILNPLTRLVLTNAIYFKGSWATEFKKDYTRPEPFTRLDGSTVQAPMMNQRETFRYAETATLQVLELPYVDEALSMVIVLPKAVDGIAQIEEDLTAANLTTWLDAMSRREVVVAIPKFKLTGKFDLNRVLTALGMGEAFSQAADFSGMTGRRDLFISAVIHQAYVNVNEEGTEAAAATGVVMKLTSAIPDRPTVFRADHPFVFMIRDNKSGSILFLGRVMDPSAEQ